MIFGWKAFHRLLERNWRGIGRESKRNWKVRNSDLVWAGLWFGFQNSACLLPKLEKRTDLEILNSPPNNIALLSESWLLINLGMVIWFLFKLLVQTSVQTFGSNFRFKLSVQTFCSDFRFKLSVQPSRDECWPRLPIYWPSPEPFRQIWIMAVIRAVIRWLVSGHG